MMLAQLALVLAALTAPATPHTAVAVCPQEADVDGDARPERLEASPGGVVLVAGQDRVALPVPAVLVHQACLGDLDGDGRAEILVSLTVGGDHDPTLRRRLFVFGGLPPTPRFLGTAGAGALEAFGLCDADGNGLCDVVVREWATSGPLTRAYRWQGFGLRALDLPPEAVPAIAAAAREPPALRLDGFGAPAPALSPAPPFGERMAAAVRPAVVQRDLRNISNLKSFSRIPAAAKGLLASQGFVVLRPSAPPEAYHSLYLENQYRGIPSFVTADAALHAAHLLFERALQEAEEALLAPALAVLVEQLAEAATDGAPGLPQSLRPSLARVRWHLAIAQALLAGEGAAPLAEDPEVTRTVAAIETAAPRYADYAPRGHYTRNPLLGRYFRALRWLSAPALADGGDQAVLVALAAATPRGRDILSKFDALLGALIGQSDGCDAVALARRLQGMLGAAPAWDRLSGLPPAWSGCEAASLLGRRRAPDGDVLRAGVDPGLRPFPSVLDVLSALGSERARHWLAPDAARFAGLPLELDRVAEAFRSGRWATSPTLATRWLYALRWVVRPFPQGYARYQTSAAWADHALVTAAAAWATLRHDTLLYVEPPIVWMEGGDEDALPPARAGFVEPLPELYAELAGVLADLNRLFRNLAGAHAAGPRRVPSAATLLASGAALLGRLGDCARATLAGAPLSRADHAFLSEIGAAFETLIAGSGRLRADPVPMVADVYVLGDPETGRKQPLLAATGPIDLLLVAVPLGRRTLLARGAVASYNEFVAAGPMTDEDWRARLADGTAPSAPPFTRHTVAWPVRPGRRPEAPRLDRRGPRGHPRFRRQPPTCPAAARRRTRSSPHDIAA